MKLEFVKLSPSENTIILVKNFYDKSKFIDVSNKLLSYGNVFAKQVGFITKPSSDQAVSRLDTIGGEFCGNATMCLLPFMQEITTLNMVKKRVYH